MGTSVSAEEMTSATNPPSALQRSINVLPPSIEVPRVLGRVDASEPGPTLIVIGGLHGNETSGVEALQRILPHLATGYGGLTRGTVVGLTGNRQALRQGRRFLVDDLNRHWIPDRVTRLRTATAPLVAEDRELMELLLKIEALQDDSSDTVYLLDLHTTSAPRLPFATLDDTLSNRPFAFAFPVPVVLGLEEELEGTLNSYVGAMGLVTAGFESGQHGTSDAVDRAEAAIWIALSAVGIVGPRPEVTVARQRLTAECEGVPHVVEVRYRHAVFPEDSYRMDPGYENFLPVYAGQALGADRRGSVRSPITGLLLMPLYQEQGADGFFVVREVKRLWLALSATLRRLRLERFLHWLPGVHRHPERFETFTVDRRYARWLALELFHLLGFRRLSTTDRFLTMTRRLDTPDRNS